MRRRDQLAETCGQGTAPVNSGAATPSSIAACPVHSLLSDRAKALTFDSASHECERLSRGCWAASRLHFRLLTQCEATTTGTGSSHLWS